MNSKRLALVLFCATVAPYSVAACAEFVPLGDLAGGDYRSSAYAVAPDGTAVSGVGATGSNFVDGVYWTPAAGMHAVFDTSNDSAANGVSNGASTVVGWFRPNSIDQWAMVWHPSTGYSRLPGSENFDWSTATDVSADGSFVVGNAGTEAYRWADSTGPVGLGDLPGGYHDSEAYAISANGKVVVGAGGGPGDRQAFRWTEEHGMVGLGKLSPADYWSSAENVSDDGNVIVGTAKTADGSERAFRWTSETGMKALSTLAGYEYGNGASAVSGDGNVIVGVARDVTSSEAAFVWDQANGMRNLQDVLISDYGLASSLAGWTLKGAADISSDGLTIVGGGLNPNGNLEAWLVRLDHPILFHIPEPTSAAAIFAFAILCGLKIRCRGRQRLSTE